MKSTFAEKLGRLPREIYVTLFCKPFLAKENTKFDDKVMLMENKKNSF